ncbi:MAG TPA: U32 family peptidase [Candidatus Megamonas gallistercoris]|nr:U32 family peptidase [Candidatus Megamonas gallistercoris]
MIELLAPAGSMEALKAAVESGADAVYLSGKMFGARAYANNFDENGLKEAIEFAHLRNVKIHVTVNTLVDNAEVAELAEYLRYLYEAGADAVLVQDLGVARIARAIVPDLPLHASTQMTVNNLAGVLALQELGFTRVVLAREVTLKDIRHICRNCNVEIEVFAHGALCVCYSGQCLMSSMIGGRSGNRGRCAQPCRLPYTLVDKNGQNILTDAGQYLLSPRDMNTIELIPDLIEAGVVSLKLEGRMKKPEYVAVVVNSYRQKIDAYYQRTDLTENVQKNLSQIFNRDFTTAYLEKKQGKFMMSDKRPNNRGRLIGRVMRYDDKARLAVIKLTENVAVGDTIDFWVKVGGRVSTNISKIFVKNKDVTEAAGGMEVAIPVQGRVHPHDRVFKVFDVRLMQKARTFFTSGAPVRRIGIDIKAIAKLGEPFYLEAVDENGYSAQVQSDFIVEKALKRAMDRQAVEKQMNRLGTTIYELRRLDCIIDDNVIVPMSVMNDARRILVEKLMTLRLKAYERPQSVVRDNAVWQKDFILNNEEIKKPELVVATDTLEKVRSAADSGADIVLFGGDSYQHEYISPDMYRQAVQICQERRCKIAFGTPRIMRDNEQTAFTKWLEHIQDLPIEAIYAHSLAQMYLIRKAGNIPIWADYSFNTYNDATINFLADYNIQGATVSPELNFKQIKTLANASPLPLECLVHGNMELMVSEYCVLGSFMGNLDKGSCTKPCEKNKYWLCDRKNEKFPIVTDQFCHMHLLNGKELNMLAHLPEFTVSRIERVRIDGRYMTNKELAKFTKLYKEVLIEGKNHVALMPENIAKYETNITRGHYFRGVE